MIEALPNQPLPRWIAEILRDPDAARAGAVPLHDILTNSVYYPACDENGTPVKFLGGNFHSFVYADYSVSEQTFRAHLHGKGPDDGFLGYACALERPLAQHELVSPGWVRPLVPTIPANGLRRMANHPPWFAHWSIWRRKPGFGATHGPEAFSFLFVGGEMSATYQDLYTSRALRPEVFVLIQPGAFGGEWERAESQDSFIHGVVLANPAGRPPLFLYGGFGGSHFYEQPCWQEYRGGAPLVLLPERYARLWRLIER